MPVAIAVTALVRPEPDIEIAWRSLHTQAIRSQQQE
jgi:hypothetical protein